ncbi:hypothetical protein BH10CHL1_BH10CHL1_13300 [soil metagenome]
MCPPHNVPTTANGHGYGHGYISMDYNTLAVSAADLRSDMLFSNLTNS